MMERQTSLERSWQIPPPRDQQSLNTGCSREQDHNNLTPQIGRNFSHPSERFQASQYGQAATDGLNNTPYFSDKQLDTARFPLPSPHRPLPHNFQNPHFEGSELMPPFSRPPPPVVGNQPHLRAADPPYQPHPSRQTADSSSGLPCPWQQFYPQPQPHCNINHQPITIPPPTLPTQANQDLTKELQNDTNWVKEFEKGITWRQMPQKSEKTSEKRNLKVNEVVRLVAEAEALSGTLCSLEQQLTKASQSAGETEWRDLILQTETSKQSLNLILARFEDQAFVQQIKKLIDQRRMKRNRARKRRKNKQLEEKKERKRLREEEEKIDSWQEKIHQEEQQKRREAVVQREADSVLGEVRQKQGEAGRLLQVLAGVCSLRQTRLKKMINHGHVFSPAADEHFTDALKRIEEVVKSQVRQYELEEQTLCVMLEGTASHKSAATGRDLSIHYEDSLKKLLFGEQRPLDTQTLDSFILADHCLETLAWRRQEWDRFVSDAGLTLASSVPLNWVVPPTHPSPAWKQHLSLSSHH